MKSVLVHDWLTSPIGGGENVLKEIHKILPSPIFTLIADKNKLSGSYFQDLDIHSSFIQNLPFSKKSFRNYLPLFPKAIESFDLTDYDLIISSSHCVAKGIKKSADQLHICYCHTPVRYAWDLMDSYLEKMSQPKRALAKMLLYSLRRWDRKTAKRVDHFIANSSFVAERIKRFYNRNAEVIYPPVNTELFQTKETKDSYYVVTSRLVQNKRIDLIVEAFSRLPDKKLLIVGEGPEKKNLVKIATKNIEFLGVQTDASLKEILQNAKGFIFAAIEDFGIAPVEAMACGTPVIALGVGGVLESVVSGVTGLFFKQQTPQSLISAISKFESSEFSPIECRNRAEMFSVDQFQHKLQSFVLSQCIDFNLNQKK